MSWKGFFAIGVVVVLAVAVIILVLPNFSSRELSSELPSPAESVPETMAPPPIEEAPADEAEMEPLPLPEPVEPPPHGIPQPNGGGVGEISRSPASVDAMDSPAPRAPPASSPPFDAISSRLPEVLLNGAGSAMENGGAPAGSGMPESSARPAARNGTGGETGLRESVPMETRSAEAPSGGAGSLDNYKVKLGADAQLQKPGPPGELKVWIGDPELDADFGPGMSTAETTVPAIGQSAKVTPFAPDFEVSPAESICMEIHPSGSEARFSIRPKATGSFKVSAEVLLYKSDVCMGSPVPKSAATLVVGVTVNKKEVAMGYLQQLWDILWQGILDFWKWLVAAIAGLGIFLIRKRLKKLFGYDAPDLGQ